MAKKKSAPVVDPSRIPKHIAIIMDGNGRWAQKRLLPRQAGHRAGIEALRRSIEMADELGVAVLTVYAFSTENWKRPQDEVGFLMSLVLEYMEAELAALDRKNVKIRILGDLDRFEPRIRAELENAVAATARNTGLVLNIALNYGGRAELLGAAQTIAQAVAAGTLQPDAITEETIQSCLYTAGLPDPDLMIRTAGEMRISNFLLWQLAYSEIWITDTLWPDFGREQLLQAIADYQQRDRRFGGLTMKK
ncbi:MAG: isoprenyl transferase [Solirubrobacterales bacterium]